jgi:3-oxoacid CoA-transferase subunit A/glutaconate CoA-transferase subunit A
LFVAQAKTEQGMQEYLDRYVRGVNDFWEYLDIVGGLQKMSSIKADALKKY